MGFFSTYFWENSYYQSGWSRLKRDKWSWYGKLYLYFSSILTAYCPNFIVFDNIYSKELFENKFHKHFDFIPYGSEVTLQSYKSSILDDIGIKTGEYFLFVGRFIPDKGLHYLIQAFEQIITNKKLVLVGGSPHESEYEQKIKSTSDSRIIFPGYIYGDDVNVLIDNAYAYIQPSDVEGLSPVICRLWGLERHYFAATSRRINILSKMMPLFFKRAISNHLGKKLNIYCVTVK